MGSIIGREKVAVNIDLRFDLSVQDFMVIVKRHNHNNAIYIPKVSKIK